MTTTTFYSSDEVRKFIKAISEKWGCEPFPYEMQPTELHLLGVPPSADANEKTPIGLEKFKETFEKE